MPNPVQESSPPVFTRLIRRNLMLFQGFVILFCLLTVVILISSIPLYYEALVERCLSQPCFIGPSPPTTASELAVYQFTPKSYATWFVFIDCTLIFLYYRAALTEWPYLLQIILLIIPLVLLIYTQIYRYRNMSTPEERQQTKWVVYGVSIALLGLIGISAIYEPPFSHGPLWYVFINAILHVFMLMIPFTLTMAILRHRLWDIDPLVNRTLVYVALTVTIIVIYTLAVLYLSRLFRTEDNFFISLVATAIVSVIFAPLKEWLQRLVNHLMKGRHDDPYAVLAELGMHLVKPIAPEGMLNVVVDTIKDALRLPYTSISIGISPPG